MVTKGSGGMRKFATAIAVFALLVLCSLVSFTPANAGKTDYDKLDLYQQDWLGKIVPHGAQGKLKFTLSGPSFQFAFEGERLDQNKGYSLLRSWEPDLLLPNRFEVIGSGTADAHGNLHISGSYNFNADLLSAVILLIPTDEISQQADGAWGLLTVNYQSKHLFGEASISFDDTTAALKRGGKSPPYSPASFDQQGLQIGQKAADFTLISAVGDKVSLYQLLQTTNKPVFLQTGSFT
jgi:hypothetical protein